MSKLIFNIEPEPTATPKCYPTREMLREIHGKPGKTGNPTALIERDACFRCQIFMYLLDYLFLKRYRA